VDKGKQVVRIGLCADFRTQNLWNLEYKAGMPPIWLWYLCICYQNSIGMEIGCCTHCIPYPSKFTILNHPVI